MIIERYYNKKIKDFNKIVKTFCEGNNINISFENFLFHDMNDICSPAYYFIHLCPKIYLVNSKAFFKYYSKLDKDFQNEIILKEQIHESLIFLKRNKKLLKILKKYQKEDSVL